MKVLGIDFTSSPNRRKPITCINCTFKGHVLRAGELEEWTEFSAFEEALQRPGPWITGIDFPFGQPRMMTNDTSQKYKAMQWKRKSNAEHTSAYHYLEHLDKKIKSEVEALESWVARAADKILSL